MANNWYFLEGICCQVNIQAELELVCAQCQKYVKNIKKREKDSIL